MWRTILALLGLVVVFGCGGQVEEPVHDTAGRLGQGGGGHAVGSAAAGGAASSGAVKSKLGDCVLGTPKAKASSCPWISDDGICYPTWDAACNCVCPLNVAEVYCMSDFPEDGVPTSVYCF